MTECEHKYESCYLKFHVSQPGTEKAAIEISVRVDDPFPELGEPDYHSWEGGSIPIKYCPLCGQFLGDPKESEGGIMKEGPSGTKWFPSGKLVQAGDKVICESDGSAFIGEISHVKDDRIVVQIGNLSIAYHKPVRDGIGVEE